jgi:hypothetical protein
LEETIEVEQAVASPFQNLELGIDSFDESACAIAEEVV